MEVDKVTVIDAQSNMEGKLKGKDVRIFGKFKGDIEITGRLVLGEGALVEARVIADSAEIGGTLKGDILVRSMLLLEKACVDGSFDAQQLAVREGAQMNGTVSAGAASKAKAQAQQGAPAAAAATPPRQTPPTPAAAEGAPAKVEGKPSEGDGSKTPPGTDAA
jgi:cytoskeletal protein CcmA (bactofilin family)